MRMQINFGEISESGFRWEFTDSSWIPGTYQTHASGTHVLLELVKQNHTKVELRSSLQVTVQLECDRCLECYAYSIDSDMRLILQYPPENHLHVRNVESGRAEIDIVMLDQPVVDLEDILRQQFLLALPEKQLCGEQCKGLCSQCGADLNKSPCACSADKEKSPFAVLAKLK